MAKLIQVPGYRIVRTLGRGGMGSVFLAEKSATKEPFAIKFLRQGYLEDPSYLQRFEREISALRAIRHPHVVNVYDWHVPESAESDDRPYVIMEYLDGEGLDKILAHGRSVPPVVACRIMLQLLDGLAAAHNVGVIHRDLGPSNVFLNPRGNGRFHVKILDFGLARGKGVAAQDSELTQEGALMGKPAYVAPEMLVGQPVDHRADIFACGVLLFRMLTGAFPYKESDSHMLWVERVRDAGNRTEYPAPSALNIEVPEALDRITSRAMRISPEERYATVEQMQEELVEVEAALADGGASPAEFASLPSSGPSMREITGASEIRSRGPHETTPTVNGVSPSRSRDPAPAPVSRRRLVLFGGASAAAAAIVTTVVLLLGSGSSRPSAPDGAAGAAPVDAGEPEAPRVAAVEAPARDAASAEPEAEPDVGAEPDAPGAKVSPEDAVDAAGPPPPTDVIVVVRGAPRNATVRVGDVTLAGDPPAATIPFGNEPLLLRVSARGYDDHIESFVPDGDREFVVSLQRSGRVVRPPPGDAGAREDDTTVRHIPTVPDDPF